MVLSCCNTRGDSDTFDDSCGCNVAFVFFMMSRVSRALGIVRLRRYSELCVLRSHGAGSILACAPVILW